MADTQDVIDQRQEEEDRRRREWEAAMRAVQELFPDATPEEQGKAATGITGSPAPRMALVNRNQKDVAQEWLTDPRKREYLRSLLRGEAGEMDAAQLREMVFGPDISGDMPRTMAQPDTLNQLNEIPVPFVRPDVSVRREDIDTPEEASRFLRKYGMDDPVTQQLLRGAYDYGGLSLEPTPFGTMSRPGGGLEWYRPQNEPGELETRLTASGRPLTTQELSAIAQERQQSFRLRDPLGIWRQITKGAVALPFAIAGGYLGGAALPAGLLGGFGAGAGAGAASGALTGDPDEIWKRALVGGAAGGIGSGVSELVGGGLAGNILSSGAKSATSAIGGQLLSGDSLDPIDVLTKIASGAAGGAMPDLGIGPLGGSLTGLGSGLLQSGLDPNDPLAGVNQQLDQNALKAETDRIEAMKAAQERWKQEYAAASAEQQRLMQERMREWQMQYEQKRSEWMAKFQAWQDAQKDKIAEALKAMGFAEGGIGSLLEEVRAQQAEAQAQAAADEAKTIESRQFFPSTLLDQTGQQGGEFAQSNVLVPHSPPPVLFGQEGMPASFGDYSQAPAPTFSAEGLLPSGSLRPGQPPSVAPMGQTRIPRYYASLLGGLTRSPYLRSA